MSPLSVWSGQLAYPAAGLIIFGTLSPTDVARCASSHFEAASASVMRTAFPTMSSYLFEHAGQQQPSSWALPLVLTLIANAPNGDFFPVSSDVTKSHSERILPFSCLMKGSSCDLPSASKRIPLPVLHPMKKRAESMILKLPISSSSSASCLSWINSMASGDELPYLTPHMA